MRPAWAAVVSGPKAGPDTTRAAAVSAGSLADCTEAGACVIAGHWDVDLSLPNGTEVDVHTQPGQGQRARSTWRWTYPSALRQVTAGNSGPYKIFLLSPRSPEV